MFKPDALAKVKKAVKDNPEYDFQYAQLNSTGVIEELHIKPGKLNPAEILEVLKAYQRLIRIIPMEHRQVAMPLLEQGIHSAIQIANMSKKNFREAAKGILGEDGKLADLIHDNALWKRSRLVIQYMNQLQNSEPHAKAARI